MTEASLYETVTAGGYDQRLVVYLDFLGFKELVSATATDQKVFKQVYELLMATTSAEFADSIYGSIPTLGLDGTKELKPAGQLTGKDKNASYKSAISTWPIRVSHFSDSIAISAEITNVQSCFLMLQLLSAVIRAFTRETIFLRGGVTVGALVHDDSGVLFGPALVEAHCLESRKADWPRVVVSAVAAAVLFKTVFPEYPLLRSLLQSAEENFFQITPATCFLAKSDLDIETRDQAGEIFVRLATFYRENAKLGPRYRALAENWLSSVAIIANTNSDHSDVG